MLYFVVHNKAAGNVWETAKLAVRVALFFASPVRSMWIEQRGAGTEARGMFRIRRARGVFDFWASVALELCSLSQILLYGRLLQFSRRVNFVT